MKNKKLMILLGILIILLDQITKILITQKDITIIPGMLSFSYTENTGVAFELLADNSKMVLISNIVWLIINLLTILFLSLFKKFFNERDRKITKKIENTLFFVIVGLLCNLIDRTTKGFVVDFIKIDIFDFYVFNIADIVLVIGVVLLIIYVLELLCFNEKKKGKEGE